MIKNNELIFKSQTFTESLMRYLRKNFDIPMFIIVFNLMPVTFENNEEMVLIEVTDNEKAPEVNIYYPVSWVMKYLQSDSFKFPDELKCKLKLYLPDRSDASLVMVTGDSFVKRASELTYCFKEHRAYDAWRKLLE